MLAESITHKSQFQRSVDSDFEYPLVKAKTVRFTMYVMWKFLRSKVLVITKPTSCISSYKVQEIPLIRHTRQQVKTKAGEKLDWQDDNEISVASESRGQKHWELELQATPHDEKCSKTEKHAPFQAEGGAQA